MHRTVNTSDVVLHAVEHEALERRIMQLALERTGAAHGALLLWDPKAKGLAIDFHVVDHLEVTLPGAVFKRRADGRANGIAFLAFDRNEPYVCEDATTDPHYAPYFLDVRSVVAVPIQYQGRPIGVISVSSLRPGAFTRRDVGELEALAASSSKFLRRAQMFRAARDRGARPFLIKGLSPEWLAVEHRIEQAAPTRAPVLIQGESGTGKELVAQSIHFNSERAAGPFVTVNCAAIPESLIESVLFGHVRGAFTGATFAKVGEFKKAHGGTLFLDELGELPLSMQAKVLRAIEYGEIQPLGSNDAAERVDVRLVCATHRDLAAMVATRQFRDDLYYRVAVVTIEVPPLRAYKDGNLAVLAPLFAQVAAQRHGKRSPRLTEGALAALYAYDFPGNVRELKNALEHAVIMATGDTIDVGELPRTMRAGRPSFAPPPFAAPPPHAPGSRRSAPPPGPPSWPPFPAAQPAAPLVVRDVATARPLGELREEWLAPLERRYLEELLAACRGNVRSAARAAGIDAVTFYRLLKKRGLRVDRRVAAR